MKHSLFVLCAVLLLTSAAVVRCQGQGGLTSIPRFEDYPVTSVFHGKPAEPAFRKGEGFRTQIRNGALKGPNFAGHYTIIKWGCGSGCISFAIVDAISGRLYYPIPFAGLAIPYQGTAGGREYKGLEYRLNSSLLVADGCPEDPQTDDSSKAEKNCGTRYYKWEQNRFVQISSIAVPAAPAKK